MDRPPPLSDRPRYPDDLADVRGELHERFTSSPMNVLLGVVVDDWGPGWARTSLEARPDMGNLAGSLHGGALYTLADAAFEIACNSYGRLAVALEITTTYHRPGPLRGRVTADAWEVTRTRRTASYRLRVDDAEGRLLLSCMALAFRTDRWTVAQDRYPADWA